jgi:all-trans-retinol 13,14-reductase
MVSGISYKQAKLAEQWDAIVIGSGIGGLTAALLLALRGDKRVLVLTRLRLRPTRCISFVATRG